jgi:hypothetical protein
MRAYLVSVLAGLCLTGCITVSPPTSMTPASAPAAVSQPAGLQGSQERLRQAVKLEAENIKACKGRLKQHQVTSAIGFVRCWSEPSRQAYQQTDLLIMDLVDQRFDVLYGAAAMLDNDQLTVEQFVEVHHTLQDWFVEELRKRFAGQALSPATAPSSPAVALHYK